MWARIQASNSSCEEYSHVVLFLDRMSFEVHGTVAGCVPSSMFEGMMCSCRLIGDDPKHGVSMLKVLRQE